MPGPIRRWTDDDLTILFHRRDVERRTWLAIGSELKRDQATCHWAYNYHRAKFLARLERAEQAPQKPVAEPVVRPRYFHDADADLKARIARQGLTAGLFGDPPPGRSALDQREGRK